VERRISPLEMSCEGAQRAYRGYQLFQRPQFRGLQREGVMWNGMMQDRACGTVTWKDGVRRARMRFQRVSLPAGGYSTESLSRAISAAPKPRINQPKIYAGNGAHLCAFAHLCIRGIQRSRRRIAYVNCGFPSHYACLGMQKRAPDQCTAACVHGATTRACQPRDGTSAEPVEAWACGAGNADCVQALSYVCKSCRRAWEYSPTKIVPPR
jgi:hypothetical protein